MHTLNPSVEQSILWAVDAKRGAILELLKDLIRIPSVNRPPGGEELACQRFVATKMRALDLDVDIFTPDSVPGITEHPGWYSGSCYTDRPNVVGVRKGSGTGPSLLLLAHADVVPEGPDGLWRHGPFNPTIEGDELIGRGSNDDKGGLAALIMALECVEAAGFHPKGDVILASVVDEESGGANGTLSVLLRGHTADGAVYCDGLDLDIHTANLGGGHLSVELQLQPEISCHQGVEQIAEILNLFYHDLRAYGRHRAELFRRDSRYTETLWPELAVRIGLVQSGTADGSNPGYARMDAFYYILPDERPDAVQTEIKERLESLGKRYSELISPPRFEWSGRLMPPSSTASDHPFVQTVSSSYRRALGKEPRKNGMPMSDLFQFNLHAPQRMPTIALGPGRWGVEGGAHEPNESVLIDEHLMPLVKTLALLIVSWCGYEVRQEACGEEK